MLPKSAKASHREMLTKRLTAYMTRAAPTSLPDQHPPPPYLSSGYRML